jgi:hypothetical protein
MSECTNGELRDLLPELVNGRLDAEMQHRVEAHVASCTECAEELALLRSLRASLMREPAIDTQRIAAAVRAHTGGAAKRGATRDGIATPWRVAIAAAALLAAGALSYVVGTHRARGVENVAVVPTPPVGIKDTASRASPAPETAHAPIVTSPRLAPVQTPPEQVAVSPPHVSPAATVPPTVASTGMIENLSDLSDDDVRTLTASLDKLSSIPDADPSPGIDPLGASLEDLSAGDSR